ncbi:hypothetical protein JCM5353_004832 [Sporobolomyces roseus]
MLRTPLRVLQSATRAARIITPRLTPPKRPQRSSTKQQLVGRRLLSSTRVVSGQVKEFKLADIGEGITECEIVKWLVKPGDMIMEFDAVAEVQSDKASVEITSPYSGRIKSIAGEVGDMLKVGATLCQVEMEGENEGEEKSEEANEASSARSSSSDSTSTQSTTTTSVQQFKLADIGEGITECEVVKWLVNPGDKIEEFDPVVEVTSDKATVEITSPFSGTIKSVAGGVGDMLKVGSTLCEIEVVNSVEETSPSSPSSGASTSPSPEEDTVPHPVRPDPSQGSSSVLATPATRRFARELGIDLTKVKPTGRDGRVTKGDVIQHSKKKEGDSQLFVPFERPPTDSPSRQIPRPSPVSISTSSALPPSPTTSTTIPLSSTRRSMFKAMSASLQIPHFAYSDTIDVTLLERLRLSLNSNVPLRYRKTLTSKDEANIEKSQQWGTNEHSQRVEKTARCDRITLLPLLLKALSTAMHVHPLFSCTLSSSSSSEPSLTRRPSHDISVAVSSPSPSGGLYTPVLRAVDSLSVFSVASNLTHLQSFLTPSSTIPQFPSQYQGAGSITLSNIGAIGGKTTHPVIPPTGQLAIGAMGRVRVEPRFAKGSEEERAKRVARGDETAEVGGEWKIEPRMVMDVSFSADHRVVEGVELARLVESWKNIIEDPTRLIV